MKFRLLFSVFIVVLCVSELVSSSPANLMIMVQGSTISIGSNGKVLIDGKSVKSKTLKKITLKDGTVVVSSNKSIMSSSSSLIITLPNGSTFTLPAGIRLKNIKISGGKVSFALTTYGTEKSISFDGKTTQTVKPKENLDVSISKNSTTGGFTLQVGGSTIEVASSSIGTGSSFQPSGKTSSGSSSQKKLDIFTKPAASPVDPD